VKLVNGNTLQLDKILGRKTIVREEIALQVAEIIAQVQEDGDEAICRLNARFDGCVLTPEQLLVSREEIDAAYGSVDEDFLAAIRKAHENISAFHRRQQQNSWFHTGNGGTILGQMVRPLKRVGIYVPGGKAPYPSSVLMNGIPARIAGVREIAMVTPPDTNGRINPHILVAAEEVGVTEIYKIGGAQGIAALAYGTKTLPQVDKITGPGNIYVTAAKQQVYGVVDIDMLAGPSEILIIADASADPEYVAADLLSQAEHDEMSAAILLTPSAALAKRVQSSVAAQTARLSRQKIINNCLENYGAIVITEDLEQAFSLANRIAPEHLELMIEEPFSWLDRVENAGAVFMGHFSPETVGDYLAGTNHVLPTSGTARFYSAIGVDTFIKKTSVIYYTSTGLHEVKKHLIKLAEVEGFTAHAAAVHVRTEESTSGR